MISLASERVQWRGSKTDEVRPSRARLATVGWRNVFERARCRRRRPEALVHWQGASRSNYQPYGSTKGSGYFPTVETRVRAVPGVVVVSYFVVSSAGAAPRATSDWGSAVRGDRRCAARGAASVEYVALPTSCELAGRAVQRRAGGPVRAGGPGAGRARARGAKLRVIYRLDLENSPGLTPTKRSRNFGKRIHDRVRCDEF